MTLVTFTWNNLYCWTWGSLAVPLGINSASASFQKPCVCIHSFQMPSRGRTRFTVFCSALTQPQYRPLGYPTNDWPPAGLHAVDHNTLRLAAQLVFSPPHCPFVESVLHQLVHEDVMGDSVYSFAKVKANNIHCSHLLHQASHHIGAGYPVAEGWFLLHKFLLTTPDNILSFLCLETASRISCSSTSPGIKVRLTNL